MPSTNGEPPPEPPQETPRPGVGSSRGGSKARSGLFTDAGPAFVANGDGPAPEAGGPLPEPEPELLAVQWEPDRVELLLRAQGEVLHTAIAVDKESGEWRYTDGELHGIAPPLANILNRHDVTRAAAAAGDELAVIVGLAGYAMRSYGARRAALERQAAADPGPQPVSGMPAPEGTGPPPDYDPDPFAFDLPDDAPDDEREPPPLGARSR